MRSTGERDARRRSPVGIEPPKGGVRLLESRHAPGFAMGMGAWPFAKIGWVAVGSGRLEHASGSTALARDHFLLMPPGWRHRFVDDPKDPLTLVIFCVSTEYFEGNPEQEADQLWRTSLRAHPPGVALRARTAFHRSELVEAFRRGLREQSECRAGWTAILQTLAAELLVRIARGYLEPDNTPRPGKRAAVAGAIELIDARPYVTPRIPDMAERAGMSPRRFTQLFKEATGETFTTYLNRRRIEYAKARLRETRHILYACYESGFRDPAYFYRVFKQFAGEPPGRFLRGDQRK